MKLSKKELGQIAKNFLNVLNRENVQSTKDLEKKLGETFLLDNSEDFISLESRPSSLGTSTYTISYTRTRTGIPIELKVNPTLGYSQIILKSQEEIKGYSQFYLDPFNNIIQNKKIQSSNFSLSIKELENLSKL